jgi:hypothetical protein
VKPSFVTPFAGRGLVYLKLARFNEARADYDSVLQQDTKAASALFGRGVAKRRLGDMAGGDADISAAKNIDAKIGETYAKYGVTP